MDTNERIRKITRQIQTKKGISLKKMSEKSGVNYSTLKGFVTGRRGFSLDVADALLNSLGLELGIRKKQEEGTQNGN